MNETKYSPDLIRRHEVAMRWVERKQWKQLLSDPERIIWNLLSDDTEALKLRSDLSFLESVGAPFGKSACNRLARDPATLWTHLERLALLVGESPIDWLDIWLEAGKPTEQP